jgi:outer membrane receptor for ferrienterochelin and colicin
LRIARFAVRECGARRGGMTTSAVALGVCLLGLGAPAHAQEEAGEAADATRHEVITVTPCRGCLTTIVNSPAAVTVISADAIANAPDRSVPELLRAVPGVNAVRTSNRDWNVTSRQGTSTLANSQLVLVDGRSIYLDFLGVVLWDLLAVAPSDIEQIEVVRGPASAVWGANAFTGVVNVLTRAPATAEGSSLALSFTSFSREAGSTLGKGSGAAYAGITTLSRKVSESLAYRISGGYGASDPFARPVGDPSTSAPSPAAGRASGRRRAARRRPGRAR